MLSNKTSSCGWICIFQHYWHRHYHLAQIMYGLTQEQNSEVVLIDIILVVIVEQNKF